METSYSNYAEAALDARRVLDHEREKLIEKLTLMENFGHLLDGADDMITTIKKQQEEIDNLRQQLADEKRQRVDVETKLAEMSKLSAGMAKKADQDDFHKALRIFLNISRRKTIGKREAAKNVITDLMTTAKLELKLKWKPFETLWGIKNLAQEKYQMQQTGAMPRRYKDIDKVFTD